MDKVITLHQLAAIRCLSMFFYNYNSDDATFLTAIDDIAHYLRERGQTFSKGISEGQLFEMYTHVGVNAQKQILEYAKAKYYNKCQLDIATEHQAAAIFSKLTNGE